jgi:uncharacterized membrane protein
MLVGMMRDDWWWPWWVSSLIDVAVVVVALVIFRLSSRRAVRTLAGLFVLAGVVAAVMAPVVMTEKADDMKGQTPMMP